jgi:nitrogen regulatory protein PII
MPGYVSFNFTSSIKKKKYLQVLNCGTQRNMGVGRQKIVVTTGKLNGETRYMCLFQEVMIKMHINYVRKTIKYTKTFIYKGNWGSGTMEIFFIHNINKIKSTNSSPPVIWKFHCIYTINIDS